MTNTVDQLTAWWTLHGGTVILWTLVATTGLVAWSLLWARKKGYTSRWLSTVSNALVLALSAEGMWEFLHDLLKLPVPIAIGTFVVGEVMLVSAMMHARAHYHRTTVWKGEGEHREVVTWGTTGRHGTTVWVIATAMGLIVATASDHWQEAPFRLALPLGAALMWHTELTAAGVGERERSSWRWTPRRLLIAIGAIEPGDRDLETVHADHVLQSLTKAAYRRHAAIWPWVQRWRDRRLTRLTLKATDEQIAEVATRLRRVHQVVDRTSVEAGDLLAEVQAEHDEQVAGLRRDLTEVTERAEQVRRSLVEHYTEEIAELEAARQAEAEQARADRQAVSEAAEQHATTLANQYAAEVERLRGELIAQAKQDRQGLAEQHAAQLAEVKRHSNQAQSEAAGAITQLKGEIRDLNRRLETLGREHDTARRKLRDMEASRDRFRQEYEESERDAEALRIELAGMTPKPAKSAAGWRALDAGSVSPAPSRPARPATTSAGSTALATVPHQTSALPRGELKASVFALLDELRPDLDEATKVVTDLITETIPACPADTAGKYWRDWREQRRQAGPRLRVVTASDNN